MSSDWIQPRQNSIEAIAHAMTVADGAEYDIRMSIDGELVLHHNARIERSEKNDLYDGLHPFVEQNHSDDLRNAGFDLFSDMIEDPRIRSAWFERDAFSCIEIKRPHPKSKIAGGYFPSKERINWIIRMMQRVEEIMENEPAPERTAVFYCFDPATMQASQKANVEIPAAPINPFIPPWGPGPVRRTMALPSFARFTVPRMVDRWRKIGSPVLPLAGAHLRSWSKYLHLGRPVSLKPRSVERLNRQRNGFPIHVWPAPINLERHILDAGMTVVSDEMDPSILQTSRGETRWMKPGTKPVNPGLWARMANPSENSKALLSEAEELPTWCDLDLSERREHVSRLAATLHCDSIPLEEGAPPWEMPRFIGHRGAGKSHKEG
jgi:glycerophosphoryl diester phosphodiesterase